MCKVILRATVVALSSVTLCSAFVTPPSVRLLTPLAQPRGFAAQHDRTTAATDIRLSMSAAPLEEELELFTWADDAESCGQMQEGGVDQEGVGRTLGKVAGVTGTAMLPFVLGVGNAAAKGGEFGIWEGRTASLLHPVLMGAMFASSVYAANLGLQWRELRTAGASISAKKAELPVLSSGKKATSPVSAEISSINAMIREKEAAGEDVSGLKNDLTTLAAAKEVDTEIEAMQQRRKDLTAIGPRDRHHTMGSLILGLGTFTAIEGPVNTFLRAKKLFPGPHLYAGAGIVVGWAVAASLVPLMQKGNEAARIAHIAINFGIIGLFLWQINTGLGITAKVIEFTHWP